MNLNEYSDWTKNTCAKLANKDLDNYHMLFGMSTEIGELQDIFKKKMAYNKDMDWVNVKEEIGDLMFYVASFCRINGFDLDNIIATNVSKLEYRYPEKFTQKSAKNRDLKGERNILEQ